MNPLASRERHALRQSPLSCASRPFKASIFKARFGRLKAFRVVPFDERCWQQRKYLAESVEVLKPG
jgi:hypothetical protein